VGELGLHLTQCRLGRGLPPYQMASWSIQLFGHNTPMLQTDRQDRRRSHSTGRTVLQTVAQKQRGGPPESSSNATNSFVAWCHQLVDGRCDFSRSSLRRSERASDCRRPSHSCRSRLKTWNLIWPFVA